MTSATPTLAPVTIPRPARAALAALEALADWETQPVTQARREALEGWPGWGALAPAFNTHPKPEWEEVHERLSELLSAKALKSGSQCVDNAFYTPARLVARMFTALERAGVTGGRILEPGCGHGRFIAGVPGSWEVVEFVGVEADPTSARIAAALHPHAQIIAEPMEATTFRAGSFDAAIGNVPFSTTHVWDRAEEFSGTLNRYMIARALAAVRPGGYVALVVPCGFLDSSLKHTPDQLKGVAELVAAVRLPSGSFAADGTSTPADVLFLRVDPTAGIRFYAGDPIRVHEDPWGSASRDVYVCGYWAEHPELVAGDIESSDSFQVPLTVRGTWEDACAAFDAAHALIEAAPATADPRNLQPYTLAELPRGADGEVLLEGEFYCDLEDRDAGVSKVRDGQLVPVPRPSAELWALLGLREAAADLLRLEADVWRDDEDGQLVAARVRARVLYEAYTARWGALNRGTLITGKVDPETGTAALSWRRPPMGGFRSDPGYVTVMALEEFDQDTGRSGPAPILLRRVNRPPVPVESVDTPDEALSVCLGERGRVDVERIASLLGVRPVHVEEVLGDRVFPDPQRGGDLVPAREYLSGDVVAKLEAARVAKARDARFARCVTALEQVQPEPLGALDVKATLGAPWLATGDLEDFYRELTGSYTSVSCCERTGTWEVDKPYGRIAADVQWGTGRLGVARLLEYGCNNKSPIVFDEHYEFGRKRRVRNDAETAAAADKLAAIQDRFETWLWEDPQRTERLLAVYNSRFNRWVRPEADGSHLQLNGLSDAVKLWQQQRAIMARVVSQDRAFCGHAVGAGKTLSMVGSAMLLRQFGLASKPMLIVPGHLLEQIAREAAQAFPMGRFLIAGKEDLAGERRRSFAARCATGDWDCVVMTHQGFGSLPVHPTREQAYLQDELSDYEAALRASGSRITAKNIARRIKTLKARIAGLMRSGKDPRTVYFERLGVDFLGVDECHVFKRLDVASRAEGFSFGASKRATDLMLKTHLLEERAEGRPHLALFTGTPFTNTFAEVYVWQKFCQPDTLARTGLHSFDQWAATFAAMRTVVEVAPDGSGFRTATRVTHIRNVPDLRMMFDQVADILPASRLQLPRPQRVAVDVVTTPTGAQTEFITGLVERADNLRKGKARVSGDGEDAKKDNMLAICGDGRRVALDPRLVAVSGVAPKITAAVADIAARYHAGKHRLLDGANGPGTLQIVFCDQGTPGAKGTQTYGRLRAGLIDAGVPAERIRWIHEAKTDAAKAALFAACRDGSVSVLLGSTEKMGHGTNVQARVSAIHHIDPPWRASDVEQREGRGIRPGNLTGRVEVVRHITESTFDAYMWQTITRKAALNAQMYEADPSAREIEDLGEVVMGYAELTAIASGNPLLLERATTAASIKRLQMVKAVDRQGVVQAHQDAKHATDRAGQSSRRAELAEAMVALLAEPSQEDTETLAALLGLSMRQLPVSGRKAKQARFDWSEDVAWRGVHLHVRWNRGVDEVTVSVSATPYGAKMRVGQWKRGAWLDSEVQHLAALIERLARRLPDEAKAHRADAAQWTQRAQELTAAAQAYRFDRQDELTQLTSRLAQIDALMAQEAQAPQAA